jgi:hypothetical protein
LSIETPASSLSGDPRADECLTNEYQSPKKHDKCYAILRDVIPQPPPTVGVYEDDEDDDDVDEYDLVVEEREQRDFIIGDEPVGFDADDWKDHVYEDPEEKDEASRLLNLSRER